MSRITERDKDLLLYEISDYCNRIMSEMSDEMKYTAKILSDIIKIVSSYRTEPPAKGK